MDNYFVVLNNINVNDKTEAKNGLTYLSWAWAWGEVKKLHPTATYTIYEDANGIPVYGLEVGQKNIVDGVEVFNKYARFTSDRLSFYDRNDTEVAYISDKKLYINNVEITGSYKIGRFVDTVLPDGGVVTKWV